MIERLRERRIKSLQASHRYYDYREKAAKEQAEFVRSKQCGRHLKEETLRELYYSSLRTYKQDNNITYRTALTGRSLSLWKRVCTKQEESEVSPEEYIKAQFDWMHRNFGTWPKISQLATDNAVVRAREFKGLSGNVVSSSIEVKKDLASIFRTAEKYLLQICRKQKLTREQVYRDLVIPGIITLPKEYLEADPTYQKVLNEYE